MLHRRSFALPLAFVAIAAISGADPAALSGANPAFAATPMAAPQAAPASAEQGRDSLLALLPADMRERGMEVLAADDELARADLAEDMTEDLAERDAMAFVFALMASDPSPMVRMEIIGELADFPGPRVRAALERAVIRDPDAAVSLDALEELRRARFEPLSALLDERLEVARRSGDEEDLRLLSRQQEHYFALGEGVMLPAFMRNPPPVFSVEVSEPLVRVVAFGDFGTGTDEQRQVAAALREYDRAHPFDLGVTMGDNFYEDGMKSPSDPRWETWWEDLYAPLGIEFYPSLGNHDWGGSNSPASEVFYSLLSTTWRMPATYYTFTAGPVQFFALDTEGLSAKQLDWLDRAIEASTARWKVVYGHHPIFTGEVEKDEEEVEFAERLLPVLRDRVDVYLAGHDHDMQHLKPLGDLHFFVAGSGGKLDGADWGPRTVFTSSSRGFAVLEADSSQLTMKFIDSDLNLLHEATITHSDPR